jgi:hypothetical protein
MNRMPTEGGVKMNEELFVKYQNGLSQKKN